MVISDADEELITISHRDELTFSEVGHCYAQSDGTLVYLNAEQHDEIMTAGVFDQSIQSGKKAKKKRKKKALNSKQALISKQSSKKKTSPLVGKKKKKTGGGPADFQAEQATPTTIKPIE